MPDETMHGTPSDMSASNLEDKVGQDKLSLAETGLFVAVEKDFTVRPGEADAASGREPIGAWRRGPGDGAADTVIAGAVILDYWGIVRADVGLRKGRIVGIGRAGDPAAGTDVDIVVGPATRMIDAAGRILTAGVIDAFVPRIGPQKIEAALAAGVTTLLAGPPDAPWNLAGAFRRWWRIVAFRDRQAGRRGRPRPRHRCRP
jgi:urease subunit alpha